MWEEYYGFNIRYFYTLCAYVGMVAVSNCAMHGHGLFKIKLCLMSVLLYTVILIFYGDFPPNCH